jgi:hypothetical protein
MGESNPFISMRKFNKDGDAATGNDKAVFGIYESAKRESGQIVAFPRHNCVKLVHVIPDNEADDRTETVKRAIQDAIPHRDKGYSNAGFHITRETTDNLTKIINGGGCSSVGLFCNKKTYVKDSEGEVEFCKKGKMGKTADIQDEPDGYTAGEAISRFIPFIMNGDLKFSNRNAAKAFLVQWAFELPEVLPPRGSEGAIQLFMKNVLSRFFAVCNGKVLPVFDAKGCPILCTLGGENAIASLTEPEENVCFEQPDDSCVFDLYYTLSFPRKMGQAPPANSKHYDKPSLDGRVGKKASPFLLSVVKSIAETLIGKKESGLWPKPLNFFFTHNEKNDKIDIVGMALQQWETVPEITDDLSSEELARIVKKHLKRSIRHPSIGTTNNARLLYYDTPLAQADVNSMLVTVGKHDAATFTRTGLTNHLKTVKPCFDELFRCEGALSSNSIFPTTALVPRANKKRVAENETETEVRPPKRRVTCNDIAFQVAELSKQFDVFTSTHAHEMLKAEEDKRKAEADKADMQRTLDKMLQLLNTNRVCGPGMEVETQTDKTGVGTDDVDSNSAT